MATQVTIAPGSNTADVADKGIAGIPARFIARYAAKNPNSKRFEITVANEVYDVTVEAPKVVAKVAESIAAPAAKKNAKKAIEKKPTPKRIRPSRSKAAIAEREAAKKK